MFVDRSGKLKGNKLLRARRFENSHHLASFRPETRIVDCCTFGWFKPGRSFAILKSSDFGHVTTLVRGLHARMMHAPPPQILYLWPPPAREILWIRDNMDCIYACCMRGSILDCTISIIYNAIIINIHLMCHKGRCTIMILHIICIIHFVSSLHPTLTYILEVFVKLSAKCQSFFILNVNFI